MAHIYHYDNQGLYINQSEARMNPREPTSLVPRNATLAEVPKTKDYEVAKFEDSYWTMIVDYRGYRYWTPDDGEGKILEAGINLPDDAIPMAESDRLIHGEDGIWYLATDEDDLRDYKLEKIKELDILINKAINSGFNSAALGDYHEYDSEPHNIAWIQSAIILADDVLVLKITCDDLKGNKDSKMMRQHTKKQLIKVLSNGMDCLLNHKTRLRDLRDKVMSAQDEASIDAVKW